MKLTAFVVRYSHGSGLEEWGDTTGISFNRVPSSWRYNRKLVENAVNSPSFLKEFTGMMQQHFGKLETYWKEIGLDKPQDIQLWVNHFISDMFYITTTGKHVNFMAKYFNSLSTNKKIDISASDSEVIAKFVTAVNLASESILFYTTVPKILRRTIYHNLSKKYHAAHDTMKELLVEIIRNRRKKIYATPIGTPIKADVLNSLIIANTERDISHKTDDEFSRPATDEEIQADLFETILASVSTTTTAFAFFIQYVGRDKNVAKKLQDEIDAVFPGDPNSECSYEGFKKLEYIEATLNECNEVSN
ncbi:3154_t:CDS:2 [Ambispora gerdemannii]|uniref:3154_t:CDS:1 n=1 Tax=Ambispora gerdemannii TaxID=144530 RepID=A0A9N9BMA0_9GLOM|nr:3154_t:CDS:2 [Ambispora gerdemannii]